MAKAVDYINETIVGDFERGYYVSKGAAVQAVDFRIKYALENLV